jgi:predicted anti-sigma-YlaC factor YlaD
MKLMFDCQTVSRLLSAGLDEQLPASQRARMRLHLVMCQNCRNADEQLTFLRAAMQRLGREEPDAKPDPVPPPTGAPR